MKKRAVSVLRWLGLEPAVIRLMRVVRRGAPSYTARSPFDTWHPVDPPPGLDVDTLRSMMFTFTIDDSPPGALEAYVHDSFHRFLHTWSLVRHDTGRCLELGGNPYFTTWLLLEHTGLDVTVANYFGGEEGTGRQVLGWTRNGQRFTREIDFDHFNSEESAFPYPDSSFDVVLYCEIIEHLLMNPVHTLREIHRVLRPGGRLVVTTPNVARLANVLAMIDGNSIYDPYSGFGPYGRHNREYSIGELAHLLGFVGFEVEQAFTADAHHEPAMSHPRVGEIASILRDRSWDLGQYLFVTARASDDPRPGLPGSLFRSYPEGEIDPNW